MKGALNRIALLGLFSLLFSACKPDQPNTSGFGTTIPATLTPTHIGQSTPTENLFPTFTQSPTLFAPTLIALPKLESGNTLNLTSVSMVDAHTGWTLTSNHVLRTVDGGNTWQDVTPSEGVYQPSKIFAPDAENAWAVSRAGENALIEIWHTRDGGATWQRSANLSNSLFYTPRQIFFSDTQTGWVLWDTTADQIHSVFTYLERTNDGGNTWEETKLFEQSSSLYTGIVFLDEQTGYAGYRLALDVSYYIITSTPQDYAEGKITPVLLKTLDGGKTWKEEALPPLKSIPDELLAGAASNYYMICGTTELSFIPPNALGDMVRCQIVPVLSGNNPSRKDDLLFYYLSEDGGQHWNSWQAAGNEFFLNKKAGWRLLSPGQLQRTMDGGSNWTTIKVVVWQTAQFDFVGDQIGWAIVSDGTSTALVQTTDGGQTWREIKPVVKGN